MGTDVLARAGRLASRPGRVATRLGRAWAEAQTDARVHHGGYRAWRRRLEALGHSIQGRRVLEVGCGDRAQLSLLLAADGANVTAVDLRPVELGRRRPIMWWALAREAGPAEAARTLVRDVVHSLRYWRTLAGLAGRPLPFDRVRPVRCRAERLPFPDESFDVIVSSAVWEHIDDVEAATAEVSRVLAPGGLAIIQIALFPSLQGGHHPEWHMVTTDPNGTVPPWDHLRRPERPLPVFLNRWREPRYREVLTRHLHVLDWEDGELRGRELLTPEIVAALPEYPERELLLSSITAWATSPRDAAGAGS